MAFEYVSTAGFKIHGDYDCRFRARNREGRLHDVSVGLFLEETLSFVKYTQWKGLQIIPIEFVVDERNNPAGYGVFKCLTTP